MKHKLKTINPVILMDKLVLLRSDINCDVIKRKIIPSPRIKEAAETIKLLKKKKAKIVIIAHQGNLGKKDFISLKQHAKQLNKFTKVKFVKSIVNKYAIKEIKNLKPGEALLLENIRFNKHEFNPNKKNNKLISKLSPLFDFYINDAFSVSHRNHTSITGFPKKLPSLIGPLLNKELNALEKIKLKKCLYILGGAKPEANMKLLGKNKVIATGLFDQLCFYAKGKKLGYQEEVIKRDALLNNFPSLIRKLKPKLKNIKTSIDFAIDKNGKRVEHSLKDFPLEYRIKDIGQKTINNHIKEIKKAKAIYMKGAVGMSMEKQFSTGTVELLKAIAKSKAYSIIGGGSLNDTIKKYKIPKNKFGYVSLSGGALTSYLAGEKLPGLKVLGYYR